MSGRLFVGQDSVDLSTLVSYTVGKHIFKSKFASLIATIKQGEEKIEFLSWIQRKGDLCDSDEDLLKEASNEGHLRFLICIFNFITMTTFYASIIAEGAACGGQVDVLRWLYEKHRDEVLEGTTHCAMYWAAESGKLDVLKWFYARRSPFESIDKIVTGAAIHNRVEIFDWLLKTFQETLRKCGKVHSVRIAIIKDCLISEDEILVMLQKLDNIWCGWNGGKHDGVTFLIAAHRGFVKVLDYLTEKIPLALIDDIVKQLCGVAAENGQIEVLKWLLERELPFSKKEAICKAAQKRKYEIIPWLLTVIDREDLESAPVADLVKTTDENGEEIYKVVRRTKL